MMPHSMRECDVIARIRKPRRISRVGTRRAGISRGRCWNCMTPAIRWYPPTAPLNTRLQRTGHGGNFVQQYVEHEGHCVFTPQQIGTAFGELVDWVDRGWRPSSGKLD